MLQACLLGGRNKNQDTAMRPQDFFICMAIANENQPPGCVSEHVPALRRYCLPFCVHRKCFRPFAPLGKLISSVFCSPAAGRTRTVITDVPSSGLSFASDGNTR